MQVNEQPILWRNVKDAVLWGVQFGAYKTYRQSRAAYFALREQVQPQNATQIQEAWWQQVNRIADQKAEDNRPVDRHDSEALACIYGYDGPIY